LHSCRCCCANSCCLYLLLLCRGTTAAVTVVRLALPEVAARHSSSSSRYVATPTSPGSPSSRAHFVVPCIELWPVCDETSLRIPASTSRVLRRASLVTKP
jgi:hypothetical protein